MQLPAADVKTRQQETQQQREIQQVLLEILPEIRPVLQAEIIISEIWKIPTIITNLIGIMIKKSL
jgi:hypothetical protein